MIKHGEILNEKIKTKELQGDQLNWVVSMCENYRPTKDYPALPYSTDWAYGGPIIDRERIKLVPFVDDTWSAGFLAGQSGVGDSPTALISAMRCYVCSKLGYEVEVPKEPVKINKPRRFI